MRDSYRVVVAELVQHAKTLDGLEAELRAASDTARGTTVTDSAYGETCGEIAAVLRRLAQAGQATLQATAEALDDAGTDLRETAKTYADDDDAARATFS